jgi:opacity protein-like surface antigen
MPYSWFASLIGCHGGCQSCRRRNKSNFGDFILKSLMLEYTVVARKLLTVVAASMLALCLTSTALADEVAVAPLGLYLGGTIGRANVRVDHHTTGDLFDLDADDLGWKAMIGVRPIAPLGAEFEYIDFGHPNRTLDAVRTDSRARGAGLFAVGYLPVPVVDVFGKVGVARLQTIAKGVSQTVQPSGEVCNNSSLSCLFDSDHTDTRFAYGGGVQFKIARLGLRAEYERISARGGDPSLLSLGAIWTF